MRIVQINAVYGVGSTGRIVQDISEALIDQGHESYVFWATRCRRDKNANLIRIGSTADHKVHALLRRLDGKQGWHSKAATRKACRQIADLRPDVVHLHNLHSNYVHLPELLRFLGEQNIPTLLTLHDSWMYTCGFCTHYYGCCDRWTKGCVDCPAVSGSRKQAAQRMYRIKQRLYEGIRHLAVNGVSRWTAEDAGHSMLKSAAHIRYIYNWVDTDIFKPQRNAEQVRKQYAIPAHHKLILGVAQGWSEKKGLNEFLFIARSLVDSATVLLVGQDEGVPSLPNLRCIGFTNDRQALVDLYSAADVFVNPSKAETFGLVTVEAMACGTPVAAFDNSGTGELVAEGCGLLVEDGNTQALADAVKSILNCGKVSYTDKCRRHVCEHYDKERQLQKYIELYEQIAGMATSAEQENA